MTLTRSMLKGMSLTDEQVSAIIDAHTESIDALKKQRDDFKETADKLKDVQKELDDLKKGKDWKAEHDKLKKEFDEFKTSTAAEKAENAKREAVREAAKKAGLSESGIAKAVKYTDLSKVELDDEGKAKDPDKLAADIKTEWGDYTATTSKKGATVETPPGTGKAQRTKEEILAIKDTAERQKAIAENHEMFGF